MRYYFCNPRNLLNIWRQFYVKNNEKNKYQIFRLSFKKLNRLNSCEIYIEKYIIIAET